MKGKNAISIIGNVGNDPEVRHLDNGRAVANFSVGCTETWTSKQGEKQSETEWFNVVLWSPLAEVAEKYIKKGAGVSIDGKIKTRSWQDQEDNKRYTTELIGREIYLLSGGGNNQQQASTTSQHQSNTGSAIPEDDTDDLPFPHGGTEKLTTDELIKTGVVS